MWAGQEHAAMFSCAWKTLGSLSFRQHASTHTCEDRVMKSSDLSFSCQIWGWIPECMVWSWAEKETQELCWILLTFGEWRVCIHFNSYLFANTHAMKWSTGSRSWILEDCWLKTCDFCYGNSATCDFLQPRLWKATPRPGRKQRQGGAVMCCLGRFLFPSFCSNMRVFTAILPSPKCLWKKYAMPHQNRHFQNNWISFGGLKAVRFYCHQKPSLEEVFATFDINSFKVRCEWWRWVGKIFRGW